MSKPRETFDARFEELIEETANHDLHSDEATTVMKNLKLFSECRPPEPEPEADTTPVPVTRWEKLKAGTSVVWDNETTRVLIKAGGAFAGVAVVAYSTIHKDHVIERQALAQANQRPS